MSWYALYVNSRAEKKVAERLDNKGYEVFCPLKTEVKQWSDRKKKVATPFFRSYVFVCFEKTQELEVLQTPGVVGVVKWLRKPAVIPHVEMEEMMLFFEKYNKPELTIEKFRVGEALTIRNGVFQDKKGIVTRQSKHKVVLTINQLGFVLSIELNKSEVRSL